MRCSAEVLKIIEAGVEGDKDKVIAYAKLLLRKLTDGDELQFKKSIKNILDGSYKKQPVLQAKNGKGILLGELSNEDLLLYMAYVIDKLDDFKRRVYASDKPDELKVSAPCNINNHAIYVEAIKRARPELYSKAKSLRQMFDEVEIYLWGGKI